MTQDTLKTILNQETRKEIQALWTYFFQIAKIPRKSGQETKIAQFYLDWAQENGFVAEQDAAGNVLIIIPATENMAVAPGIILQGHLDMVCVGDPDPAQFGVTPILSSDSKWLQAGNTSLGADNGIGLAILMSLSQNLPLHGPLALMLTVNEEVGIGGALNLGFKAPLSDYKYLLNLDSEDLGVATISSAGGGDTIISLPLETESSPSQTTLLLTLSGLIGGHSGVEIHRGHLNAIKVTADVLEGLSSQIESFRIVSLDLGYARNVIPSSGQIVISVSQNDHSQVEPIISLVISQILSRSQHREEQRLAISISEVGRSSQITTKSTTTKIISLLQNLPHGVISWSPKISDLVQTSTNLAKIVTTKNEVVIDMMTRSSARDELSLVRDKIDAAAAPHLAKVNHEPSYPGWPADPDSQIIKFAQNAWQEISGGNLQVLAIHAGLECGAIISKYPFLEAISIGPDIQGAHSIKERVSLESVSTFYLFVVNLINQIYQK